MTNNCLSRDEVDALMPAGDQVHTMRQIIMVPKPGVSGQPMDIHFGCDMDRESILRWADEGRIVRAGENATKMKHGLATKVDEGYYIFIATEAEDFQSPITEN